MIKLAETDGRNNLTQRLTLQKRLEKAGLPFCRNGMVSHTEGKASVLTVLLVLRSILS